MISNNISNTDELEIWNSFQFRTKSVLSIAPHGDIYEMKSAVYHERIGIKMLNARDDERFNDFTEFFSSAVLSHLII